MFSSQHVMMGTLDRLPGTTRRKAGTTSNHHAPYGLGYTRATMALTKGSSGVSLSESQKQRLSSDCSLQPDYTKLESLVIADQHAAVNTFPGLVHTPWEPAMPEVSDPTAKRELPKAGLMTGVKS